MKKSAFLLICFSLAFSGMIKSQAQKNNAVSGEGSVIVVYPAPEVEPLVKIWAKEFSAASAAYKVNIAGTGARYDLMFVSDETLPESDAQWKTVVGREIIVPVTGTGNPLLADISAVGVSRTAMLNLLTMPSADSWKAIPGNKEGNAVHCYIVNDAAVISRVTDFLGIPVDAHNMEVVADSPALLEALHRNPYSIGFCRLTDVTAANGQEFNKEIRPVQIDINSNGVSDYFEQIYADYSSFMRGVYIGKYPRELFSNVYCVSGSYPKNRAEIEFIRFIITGGQSIMPAAGYTSLASGESQSRLAALYEGTIPESEFTGGFSLLKSFLLMLAAIIAVSLAAYGIYRYIRSGVKDIAMADAIRSASFSERSLVTPKGLLFDRSHMWAFMEKDGQVRVGIDEFLQHVTGTITRVRMKNPGERVKKGEYLVSLVQNGKQLDIYSPVTGTITKRNEALASNSSMINSSPYAEGWVYMVEPDNWLKEANLMIMAGKYIEWIKDEFTRLKDFLAVILGTGNPQYSHVVLQDGGELKEDLLEEFGPKVWEDFQTEFINKSR